MHERKLSGPVPPRATRAVVIDDRGDEHAATIADGVWTVIVDASEQFVRFTDAAGELVAQPLPEGPRMRVGDAPEACPACAAVAWAVIGNAVICERCGHVAGTVEDDSSGGGAEMIRFAEFGDAGLTGRTPSNVTPQCAVAASSTSSRTRRRRRRRRRS